MQDVDRVVVRFSMCVSLALVVVVLVNGVNRRNERIALAFVGLRELTEFASWAKASDRAETCVKSRRTGFKRLNRS